MEQVYLQDRKHVMHLLLGPTKFALLLDKLLRRQQSVSLMFLVMLVLFFIIDYLFSLNQLSIILDPGFNEDQFEALEENGGKNKTVEGLLFSRVPLPLTFKNYVEVMFNIHLFTFQVSLIVFG